MTKKKTFKQLVKNFDSEKQDFTYLLPYLTGTQKPDFANFPGNLIGKWAAIQTFWQLSQPQKISSRSRVWQSTNGYIFLVAWSNASLLRVLGVKWFNYFKSNQIKRYYRNLEETRDSSKFLYNPSCPAKPASGVTLELDWQSGVRSSNSPLDSSKGLKYLDRLEAQFLDCLRSAVVNIEEGFARPTTSEYLEFLGYSQASLKEAKGDIQRSVQDGLLRSVPGSSLQDLGINLKDWHEALKKSVISKPMDSPKSSIKSSNGSYGKLKEFKFNYPSVDNLDPSSLIYEIFIELVNKTDWHLRKLVESLEKKLENEKMDYNIDQARIKDKIRY